MSDLRFIGPRYSVPRRQFVAGLAGTGLAALSSPLAFADAKAARRKLNPAGQPVGLFIKYDGYLVTGFGTTRIAQASMRFTRAADTYRIVLDVNSMLADLSYESSGRIDDYGLVPVNYIERRKVAFKSRRVKKVSYVITDDSALINRRDGDSLYVPPGTQDRLSLMLQMSLLARSDPSVLEPEHALAIPFARIKRVASSRWKAAPEAHVALDSDDEQSNSRQVLAQRIARVADSNESVEVAFWLSADRRRFPLVLQFSESGRSLRFVAKQ